MPVRCQDCRIVKRLLKERNELERRVLVLENLLMRVQGAIFAWKNLREPNLDKKWAKSLLRAAKKNR